MAGAVNPNVGDFVGLDVQTGDWLFVNAVDLDAYCVQIGPLGASSPWFDEPQAKARFNYTWGARNTIPYSGGATWPGYLQYPATRYDDAPAPTERLPAPPPLRCECGTGDHTRSGAHSHWCPCWVSV